MCARARTLLMANAPLQKIIEAAWDKRESISSATRGEMRDAVEAALDLLDKGQARVAEKIDGAWVVHQWLKKAVLLSFRLNDMGLIAGAPGGASWWDKVPSKFEGMTAEAYRKAGYRAVPGAVVRRSAYIGPSVVLMPSFVNLGAYVDSGTMVDTWATVGSCAQIGKNVHLSGGVGIGGVLEPLQANPTIIEDNCFVGARSEVVEGVIVGEGSVLAMGTFIGASTKVVDRGDRQDPHRPGAALFGGGVGLAAGQAVPQQRAGPLPLLRRDRQDRGRADARQDRYQRAAAGLIAPCERPALTARSIPTKSSRPSASCATASSSAFPAPASARCARSCCCWQARTRPGPRRSPAATSPCASPSSSCSWRELPRWPGSCGCS